MERESTKHGRRLDDELSHETASLTTGAPVIGRSQEDKRQEDPDEGLDVEGAEVRPDVPGREPLPAEEATARAELARAVASARFPAERDELLAAARHAGADDRVLEELAGLEPGSAFANVQGVWEALGGHREQRGAGFE